MLYLNLFFTGAPTARVFGDRLYVYPSADNAAAWGPKYSSPPLMEGYYYAPPGFQETGFCNPSYTVFSTNDSTLETNWVSHENILNENQVPWTYKPPGSGRMGALDVVQGDDGKYYRKKCK